MRDCQERITDTGYCEIFVTFYNFFQHLKIFFCCFLGKIQSGKYFRVWPIDSEELENIFIGVSQFIVYFVHSI